MPTYFRDDQTSITVVLNGKPYTGWDSVSGGDLSANTVKYRTLDAGEIDLGGPGTRADITVGIQMSDTVAAVWVPAFEAANGDGKVSLNVKFLDGSGAVAAQRGRSGVLKGVKTPDMDRSNSSPNRAVFEITVGAHELGS